MSSQHDHGDAGEVDAVAPVALDGVAGQVEQLVDAGQRRRLVALLRVQVLRRHPGDQLDVQLPGGALVLGERLPLHLQERRGDPQ